MKSISSILVIGCFVAAIACNRTASEEQTEMAVEVAEEVAGPDIKDDAAFARQIAQSNLLNIQLGELAQAKSSSANMKKLADEMINTHKTANKELKAWAAGKNVLIPTELDGDHMEIYDKLADTPDGEDFDKAYHNEIVKSHGLDLRALEKENDNGKDPDLKLWAAQKIPVWQSHLDMAKKEDTADTKD